MTPTADAGPPASISGSTPPGMDAFPANAPPRVLVTKIGLDGHDRGSRIVAAYLRDAGMDVIYTPPWQQVAAVARLAAEEDVDVIGVSSLSTDHLLIPGLMDVLRRDGLGHVRVVVGGIVPDGEEAALLESGVARVFHPGAGRDEIVGHIATLARQARDDQEDIL